MGKKYYTSGSRGQVLLIVIITMIIALTAGLSIASRTITNLKLSKQNEDSQRAFQAATAGIERYIENLSPDGTPNNLSNSSFKTNVVTVSDSKLALNNNALVDQDRGIDLWLSTYPKFTSPISGSSVTIYWGTQDQLNNCNVPNTHASPALEVLLLSNASTPTLTKYVYDPCSGRRTDNHFLTPQGTQETGGSGGPSGPVCPASGLTHYWGMNETSSNQVADSIGSTNGTAASGATITTGKIANARLFNGTVNQGYVDFGNNISFDRTNPFSFSFWVNEAAGSGSQFIIAKQDNLVDGRGYSITSDGSGHVSFNLYNNTGNALSVGSNIDIRGGWHYIAAVYDGASTVKLYVDEQQPVTTAGPALSGTIAGTDPFLFGARENASFNILNGKLDEVGVWNRALTAGEVSTLYNGGTGLSCIPTAPLPTPTGTTGFTGETVGGTKFFYKTDPIPLTNALVMKVIPIYAPSKIGATISSGVFPSQGKIIESVGSSGETKRKVVFYESYPQIPNEVFPYSILSQGTW